MRTKIIINKSPELVNTPYVSVKYYTDNEQYEEWLKCELLYEWKVFFSILPRRSRFSRKILWGKICRRNVQVLRLGAIPVAKFSEYATEREVFESKLKGESV